MRDVDEETELLDAFCQAVVELPKLYRDFLLALMVGMYQEQHEEVKP